MIVSYLRVRLPLMDMQITETVEGLEIHVVDSWSLGTARDFVAQAYMGSLFTLCSMVTRHLTLFCDFSGPNDLSGWKGLNGCDIRFNQKDNRAVLPMGSSERPLPAEQQRASYLISEQTRHEIHVDDDREVVTQTRSCLTAAPGREANLESVAERLGISPRSLRRQLQLAGFSFKEIRNEVRRKFAVRYLAGTRMPVEKIAARLGYGDQAAFSKAFRSWTGKTPGQVRRSGNMDED